LHDVICEWHLMILTPITNGWKVEEHLIQIKSCSNLTQDGSYS